MAFKSRNGSGGSRKKDYVSVCRKTLDGIVKTLKRSVSDVVMKISSYMPVKKNGKLLSESSESQTRPFGKSYTVYDVQGKGRVVIKDIEETFEDIGGADIQLVSAEKPMKVTPKVPSFPGKDIRISGNSDSTVSCGNMLVHTSTSIAVETTSTSIERTVMNPATLEPEKVGPAEVIVDPSNKHVGDMVTPSVRRMNVKYATDEALSTLMCPYNNEDISVENYVYMQDDGYNPFDLKRKLFEPHPVADRDIFAEENGAMVDGIEIYAPLHAESYSQDDGMILFEFSAIPDVPKVQETVKALVEQRSEAVQQDIPPAAIFSFGAVASASGCTVSFTF